MTYKILAVSVAMILCAMTAFAEETAYPYLKAGVGYGTNYGAGTGFNNELMFNDYVSAQVGAGYLDHIGWGVAAGLTMYPAGSTNRYFSPRFTALYGRVGRVDKNDGAKGHSYDAGDGIALGIGGLFPICKIKRLTGNVDVYYTEPKLPDGYEIKDSAHFKFSAGIAYAFGGPDPVHK
jgi:hypothetical protein